MTGRLCTLLLILWGAQTAAAQNATERPLTFEGYTLSDSLEYSAETIDYLFGEKKIILDTNASINYLGRMLKSDTITYYQDHEYMEALGEADSTGALTNTPAFTDLTGEVLDGDQIKYDLDTQEGLVLRGRTTYEEGFMTADTIKRVSTDTLYVENGTYTTCDLDHPHFYFHGRQMKFIVNDKLIIKPITAYMFDIPVMWMPFYVFPIARGRQSGFLVPRYGESRDDGRYFSNIGYYLALSEYYDYRFSTTLREKNGWLVNNWINYNKRYSMSGSIYGSFENEPRNGTKQWRLNGSHRHTVSPTFDINGTINMQSSEFSKNNSSNLYQVLNRNMRSSVTMTKRWRESGNSLIVTMDHQKNLDSQNRTVTLPSLSFRMPNKLLFGDDEPRTQRKYSRKSTDAVSEADRAWYQNIYYGFNASFKNTEADTYAKSPEQREIERLNPDINRYDLHDYRSVKNLGISASLTASNKFMGWLTANPRLSISETFEATTDSVGYRRNDNLSMGLDLSTKVYGTFNPTIGSLRGLRHVISPSVSYSHGLRRSYEGVDADALYRFDLNDLEKPQNRRMTISLRNIFQAKLVEGETEKKVDLFSLNFSTGIDFEKGGRRLSPLSTTLDMKPSNFLKIIFRSTHELYNSVDKFEPFSPGLTSMSITSTIGVSDRDLGPTRQSSRVNANKDMGRDLFDTDIDTGDADMSADAGSATGAFPFNLQLQHLYSRTRTGTPGDYSYRERHTIKPTLRFSPTKNFSVNYFLYYDLKDQTINDQRITLKRDLHCWEANLYWVISGIRQGFYLKINIKDLPDVKIEQRRGVSRYAG